MKKRKRLALLDGGVPKKKGTPKRKKLELLSETKPKIKRSLKKETEIPEEDANDTPTMIGNKYYFRCKRHNQRIDIAVCVYRRIKRKDGCKTCPQYKNDILPMLK